ncbi:helicase-associated domain-containing protein [Microbacterium sp.]|uniref:helicase-associated domain-containing protein n=1 Tax=Microbacterium sp. TaxID=51671 RepID=UPI0033419F4D
MSTHARPLAVRLAAAGDDELGALFQARGVRPDPGWQDFFDAAEALLEPASVERALTALTLPQAAALLRVEAGGDAGAPRAHLIALGLLDGEGSLPVPVADLLIARDGVPSPDGTPLPEPSSESAAARAAERAFTTVGRVADLLLSVRESAPSLLATGQLSAGDRKRLAESGIPTEEIDDLRALAVSAGLLHVGDRRLLLGEAAALWLPASFADRWSALASAFRADLPAGVRTDGSWTPPSTWPLAYPWDGGWPAQAERLATRLGLLGLSGDDGSEPVWAGPVRTGAAVDPAPLAALVPAEVDKVFLQNDLTAIAPGPLVPSLELRLRGMTEHESSGSSSYRFTEDSLTRALVDGETEQGLVEFLTALSLTGMPQPLAYLISQSSQRHGLVRVWQTATGTTITSRDPHLIEALGVDRGLRPLALLPEDGMLVSRVGAETVYWALVDARYPATLVDADGDPVPATRTPAAAPPVEPAPSYAPLIARLRSRQGPDADAAWLDRELDAAVRGKATIVVEVGMPDGSTRELTLEAAGLGGGRLRGRDREADVERTLPVRSILSVRPA